MASIRRLISAFRQSPRLAVAFSIAAILVLFFAVRLIIGIVAWDPPPDEEIRPWMTVGYIGRSWNLDPREIDAAAGLPFPEDRASEPRPYTLAEIADERGVPVEEVIAIVTDAIATLRQQEQGTPPVPPPPATAPPDAPALR